MGETCSRGIYLVANRISSEHCHNLIYTIRQCGCRLPIRIIPYGGEPLVLKERFEDVALVRMEDFPVEGREFVAELERRLSCSPGFLRRFLSWFGEFDEFLYSDNDIVALMNWEEMFGFLGECELVHADHEYRAGGIYNLLQPARFEELLGPGALEQAITAGHFLCRRSARHVDDLLAGLNWMEAHPEVPKWHDQTLLQVAAVLGKWQALNLCKPQHNWASSWAGDYRNSLDVVRTVQVLRQPLSHLHFSGGTPSGAAPIHELLYANLPAGERNQRLLRALLSEASGVDEARRLLKRVRNRVKGIRAGKS